MTFHPVLPDDAIAEGQLVAAEVEGRAIILCREEGVLHALDNLCTHSGSRFDRGRLVKGSLTCPLHGARFDLSTGECRNARLGFRPIVTHRVRVADGRIEVALSPRPVAEPLT